MEVGRALCIESNDFTVDNRRADRERATAARMRSRQAV
jgi:hypothetical protein